MGAVLCFGQASGMRHESWLNLQQMLYLDLTHTSTDTIAIELFVEAPHGTTETSVTD